MNDRAFEALANGRRRRLLLELERRDPADGPLDVQNVLGDGTVDADEVYVDLHHSQLPKLERSGYVAWAPGEGVVERGPQFDEIQPLLRFLNGGQETTSDSSEKTTSDSSEKTTSDSSQETA